ncbi:hypothetical protein [Enterovibrio nigricans]|uniref:Uncharacterized protein n=1 Tax=Enterovibrio nigricans DSM 22720 TaxID=1121868 RepID=A0A1T4VJW1_9GAMM|nr:hypothetical protein [Enterovibrio nigricans]PKF49640.1 hypothetical protein AT251_17450 [Enterovibrio nigricans]SKA65260.1 hypothetical protein SAMN02745132_03947 [Enterovibrio nigricans DSM 22720]
MSAIFIVFQQCLLSMARFRALFVFCISIVVLSCASDKPSSAPTAAGSQIEDDDILLVGKISVVPVLSSPVSRETDTLSLFADEHVLLWLRPTFSDVGEGKDEGLALDVEWGETFSHVIPKRNVNLFRLERGKGREEGMTYSTLAMPEPLRVLVRVDDQAIYIGHLRLYIDEFHDIVSFEVVDESGGLQSMRKQTQGDRAHFRVSLLAPAAQFQ